MNEINYVVECCPYCDREVEIPWDTENLGYKAHCPYCGNTLMLCDECQHRGKSADNWAYCDDCDWSEGSCMMMQPLL